MLKRDLFHLAVRRALEKDRWTITANPLWVGGISIAIDLGADRLIAADRDSEKIAVEVKSFLSRVSAISEFHIALGQFLNYRAVLRLDSPERELFLAVPTSAYDTFFSCQFLKNRLKILK